MVVKVDRSKCIGCGLCASLCPNVFKIVEGKSQVIDPNGECENLENARDSCPAGAISIE